MWAIATVMWAIAFVVLLNLIQRDSSQGNSLPETAAKSADG
jgi:hypothetical protein